MEFVPKIKKLLTRPLLKLQEDVPVYIKIETKMALGKEMKKRKGDDEKQKEPATLVNCVNLSDGSLQQLIVNAVVKSVWNEDYPDDSYVGKCFAITKLGRAAGKNYNPFRIAEIDDPAVAEKAAVADTKPATKK